MSVRSGSVVDEGKMLKKLKTLKAKANEAFKAGQYQQAYSAYTTLLAMEPDNDSFNATVVYNRGIAAGMPSARCANR